MAFQADCAPAPPVILILIVGQRRLMQVGKKEKSTPFGVNIMRSQGLYWAAHGLMQVKCLHVYHF